MNEDEEVLPPDEEIDLAETDHDDLETDLEDDLFAGDEILEEDDMPEEFAGLDGSNTDY